MKRTKPEVNSPSVGEFSVNSSLAKRFNPSPQLFFGQPSGFFNPAGQMSPMSMLQLQYHHMNQQQNSFLFGQATAAASSVSSNWQYTQQLKPQTPQQQHQKQNMLVFDSTQPPPVVQQRNSPVPLLPTGTINVSQLTQQAIQPDKGPPPRSPGIGLMRPRIFENQHLRKNAVYTILQTNPNLPSHPLATPELTNENNGETNENNVTINKKKKRKPMSTRYTRKKEWDRDDAIKALELEKEYNCLQKTPMLILKFPDPDLNKYIVKNYSTSIETVHFQQPSTPRYCFVQLKQDADIEKVRAEICKIPFGTGKIVAERKFQSAEESQPVTPEEIDPYTLYIGNLPTQISVKTVKEHFPRAQRIDIGYAQRMKYTRYAFVRYATLEDAMAAYKKAFNSLIANRSLIVRFRRAKGNIGLPGESKALNQKKSVATIVTDIVTSATITTADLTASPNNVLSDVISKDSPTLLVQKENSQVDLQGSNDIDSKDNVLTEADRLKASTGAGIKDEPLQSSSCRSGEDNDYILGSRIKDELFDDDELLAQAECYQDIIDPEDYDYALEEEDDILPSHFEDTSRPPALLFEDQENESSNKESPQHNDWEIFRQTELSQQETKANLSTIQPQQGISPNIQNTGDNVLGASANTKSAINSNSLKRVFNKKNDKNIFTMEKKEDHLDDLFRRMNPRVFNKKKDKNIFTVEKKKDDLDDLFRRMNPDTDDEDCSLYIPFVDKK